MHYCQVSLGWFSLVVVLISLLSSFCGLVFISGGSECIVVEFIWARFH